MGSKHVRMFRRALRAELNRPHLRDAHENTRAGMATIMARHYQREYGGSVTPTQALRACAMVTGTPLVRVGRSVPPGTRVLMWPPAQGETWAGNLRNGWA